MMAAVLLAGEAERLQRRDQQADRRATDKTRERRRTKLYQALTRTLGRVAALALLSGPALEWAAAAQFEALPPGALLTRGEVPLVLLAVALLAQAHYSANERRIAEAMGVVSFMAIAYWDISRDASVRRLQFGTEVEELLATGRDVVRESRPWPRCCGQSCRSRSDAMRGPPTEQLIAILRRRDRDNIKAAIVFTATLAVPVGVGALLILAPAGEGVPPEEFGLLIEAAPWPVGWASLARGVWFPLTVAGFGLLARGRWKHRHVGTVWSAALLLSGVIAWFVGQGIADGRLDAARLLLP